MANETGLETTASEACTRGGAFALLLSLALASLIPVWVHRKDEMVLERYLGLRLSLIAALDALDDDPIWQEYKQTHDADSLTVEQLATLQVNSTTLASVSDLGPAQPKPEPKRLGQSARTTTSGQPSPQSKNPRSPPAIQTRPTPLLALVPLCELTKVGKSPTI